MSCVSMCAVLLVLAISTSSAQGAWRRDSLSPRGPYLEDMDDSEWTTWFNVDHPGGRGDYEQLDAIRFYYRARVCAVPLAIEARTTNWIPAASTGEIVHMDPAIGFWCINDEQPAGHNCSNYAVRFLCSRDKSVAAVKGTWGPWSEWSDCPAQCGQVAVQKRSRNCNSKSHQRGQQCNGPAVEGRMCQGPECPGCDLQCTMGRVNAECDACMCEDHTLLGSIRSTGGLPAPGAAILRSGPQPKLLTVSDHNGHFRIPGVCPDGNSSLTVQLANHAPHNFIVPLSTERTSVLHVKLERASNDSVKHLTHTHTQIHKAHT